MCLSVPVLVGGGGELGANQCRREPAKAVTLFEGSLEDRYHDPGTPFQIMNPAGKMVVEVTPDGQGIFYRGRGGTLTPFGFQNEDRTYWQAPDVYFKMSPFSYADKIKAPLLLIHGEADNNTGTWPFQSERLFSAIKGHGGTVRLVLLPLESHGYAARESVLHMLWEMNNWLETYVKNMRPVAVPDRATTTKP